jgi:tetratricopeptide (TPR) repeat protein
MLNGDLVEADSVMQEARRFAPCPATTTHLVSVLHGLDRENEAREVLRAAVDQWPTNPFLRMDQAHFLATAGRYRAAHDDVERRLHHGFTLPFALRAEAVFDAVEGRVDESIEHLRRLQEYQLEADLLAPALEVSAAIGRLKVVAGDAPGARREVEDFLARHPLSSLDAAERPYLSLALFFANAGDPHRARRLMADYDGLVPGRFKRPDRWMQHRVRAAVLMAVDSPAAALGELQQAQSSDRIWSEWLDNAFFTMDQRPELARVYDRMGQPDSAIAVYERYVNARILYRAEMDAFHLAPALLRLAELHEEGNRAADAAAYYDRLSSLWKNADAQLTSLRPVRKTSPAD